MAFFSPSKTSKVTQLQTGIKSIEATLAQARDTCADVWDFDARLTAIRQEVQKQPTPDNTRELMQLISQRSAAVEVLQFLAVIEGERRNSLRLSLRGLAHDAADEAEKALRTRLAEVEKSDAQASAELEKPIRSLEVLAEIRRRLEYLGNARGHLDRGEMGQAFGRIAQSADVVL